MWKAEYYDSYPNSQSMTTARVMYHLGHVSLCVYIHSLYLATGSEW